MFAVGISQGQNLRTDTIDENEDIRFQRLQRHQSVHPQHPAQARHGHSSSWSMLGITSLLALFFELISCHLPQIVECHNATSRIGHDMTHLRRWGSRLAHGNPFEVVVHTHSEGPLHMVLRVRRTSTTGAPTSVRPTCARRCSRITGKAVTTSKAGEPTSRRACHLSVDRSESLRARHVESRGSS